MKLLDFFGASPARLQGLLIGALAAVSLCLALLVYGEWWRGEAFKARGQRDTALEQARVLVSAVNACTASVADGKRAGEAAIARGQQLLAAARRLHAAGTQAAQRIDEDLIRKKPPARADGKPAGCDEAWAQLEAASKAGAP